METKDTTSQRLWGTEFDKQYTTDMLTDLLKRAAAVIKRYERYTPRKSTDTAEDRVNTAVMKLFDGDRIWDPSRVDLAGFLLGVIASDLTSELRRSALAPLISFEDRKRMREDDYTGEPCDDSSIECRASIEEGMPVPHAPASFDEAWAVAMKHLYALADGDKLVIGLLDAYEEGAYQKRDVIANRKWSSRTYKTAYARLVALADTADPAIREAILYVFTN